ncbi:MAG: FAD-binding oxidoreductase [Alphaproteobacteria bacterium]|nr:FAD-binding oxidoreductase [Rhodospirillales bacterium]MCW9046285.1 FAD-binding oxidoreductase [Alphaproteobacteria bacterium]
MIYDFIVVGAGIAGASAAYALLETSPRGLKVLLLEREDIPGFHSTGRSAALYSETYGHPVISGLTRLSRPFFDQPPMGFSEHPILTPRGVMLAGDSTQAQEVEDLYNTFKDDVEGLKHISGDEALKLNPALKKEAVHSAMFESRAMDMDVNALHQGFLRGFKAKGGEVLNKAEVSSLERRGNIWSVETRAGEFQGGVVINGAGAWVDVVAEMAELSPLGFVPKRRTAFTFKGPESLDLSEAPMVVNVNEDYYFKPDAGVIIGSPADETPVPPCDVQPEELDIAIAVDLLQKATVFEISQILTKWAGLRTFAPDKVPVVGSAPAEDSFIWVAGQGGYGIMTSWGMARATALLALGMEFPGEFSDAGVTVNALSPMRFS